MLIPLPRMFMLSLNWGFTEHGFYYRKAVLRSQDQYWGLAYCPQGPGFPERPPPYTPLEGFAQQHCTDYVGSPLSEVYLFSHRWRWPEAWAPYHSLWSPTAEDVQQALSKHFLNVEQTNSIRRKKRMWHSYTHIQKMTLMRSTHLGKWIKGRTLSKTCTWFILVGERTAIINNFFFLLRIFLHTPSFIQ